MPIAQRSELTRREGVDISRRQALKVGGVIIAGAAVGGCATATGISPVIPPVAKLVQDPRQTEPTPAQPGSRASAATSPQDKPTWIASTSDPYAFSLADNLFWNDIMMEHVMFFAQLMPGPELEEPRKQAEEFQRLFARQLELSGGIKPDDYVAFNRTSIALARRVSEYKRRSAELQASGRMRSLAWPSFFTHTADEAEWFAARLEQYNRGRVDFDRAAVVDFWTKTLGEHSGFIAHLLDPEERLLIDQASQLERSLRQQHFRNLHGDEVLKAAREVLAFKAVAEKGIYAGKIKSIISPRLVSHVRREAVRSIDELQRT
jgi:hypothetical protein